MNTNPLNDDEKRLILTMFVLAGMGLFLTVLLPFVL